MHLENYARQFFPDYLQVSWSDPWKLYSFHATHVVLVKNGSWHLYVDYRNWVLFPTKRAPYSFRTPLSSAVFHIGREQCLSALMIFEIFQCTLFLNVLPDCLTSTIFNSGHYKTAYTADIYIVNNMTYCIVFHCIVLLDIWLSGQYVWVYNIITWNVINI